MLKSMYIHIPFCSDICTYCDFCKVYYNKNFVRDYLTALEKEIMTNYQGEELETIYIGGGTPSCLSLAELKRLFNILEIVKRKANCEITIEGNFESTTKEKLELYKSFGINRLSFGIETTNKQRLAYLNRKLDKQRVEKIIQTAKELGFNNINVDLMYALKDETTNDLLEDINYILSLNIEHISTYSLMIEDHTILKLKGEEPISEDLDEEMYQTICRELKKNDYIHYEISNFAKEGYQSKHNLTYWLNEEYYGFGLGASSYLNNKREENTRSITNYLKGIYNKISEELTIEDKMYYEIICNIRLQEGISLNKFREKYKKDLQDIFPFQDLLKEKLLIERNNKLFIPEEKWYISNEILIRWLG